VPCIECNRSIKFRDLLKTARELGAAALATGHYVASRRLRDGSRAMVCAADADRDQSYFLFATTREQLDYLRFPLGDMTKPQARELARRFELNVADKQDSQDICFVPTGRYTDIIGRLRPNAIEPGDIVDLDGHVIGRHQGIVHFTVGQRRGLGIASAAPLYVVRLDAASRRVVVGPREALRMDRIVLRDVNWIGDGALDRAVGEGLEIFVRVRSTRAPQPAWLRAGERSRYEVELVAGEEGVSPGQACVFYDAASGQARVLGGGFIQSATARRGTAKGAASETAAPQPLIEAMRG
jgi:tRNA-uridine 2-sulfurtransferase